VVAPLELDEAEIALAHPAVRRALAQLDEQAALLEAREQAVRASLATARRAVDAEPGPEQYSATDNRTRKAKLYQLYKQSTTFGSAVDVVAKRFISGEWAIVPRKVLSPRTGRQTTIAGDPHDQLLLMEYFRYCNQDEDFKQILQKQVKDIMVFGETYSEIVYRAGIPYELYSCNTVAMDYVPDGYGGVKRYTYQKPGASRRPTPIDPTLIVRVWDPDLLDAQAGFSSAQGAVNPLFSDQMMVRTQQATFANMGSSAQVHYQMEQGDAKSAEALRALVADQYSGPRNAARERVTFGAKVVALNLKGLDSDFLKGREEARYETLGRMHVPPHMVSLIEAGNLGGGTGEAQERNFINNVLNYYKSLILEKLTYQIIVLRFGIAAWVLDLTFADYAADEYESKCRTINEVRAESGRPPIPGGDVPILIVEHRGLQPEVAPGETPVQSKAPTDVGGTPTAPPAGEPETPPAGDHS
jgi:hypothetical protein